MPHYPPTATPTSVVARIEKLRRDKKWSARRITPKLSSDAAGARAGYVYLHSVVDGFFHSHALRP
ncbi:hypothetical protein GFS60_01856 [Rhodococcus sp. WAY2]|nr:hypothetical protein [Rhodococcus sp. WAY2]QHE68327.1 hypothetical protein GFS60_01856 [Rhodococcus sp. WAY2]